MISAKKKNSFCDGVRTVVFHKSELVETIASLHSLYAEKSEKLHSLKNLEDQLNDLAPSVKYSLWKYGESYAGWLLIMDIATYISSMHYEETGETYLTFDAAMKEYEKIDLVTYLNIFLGMPALGYERSDAARWLKDPDTMSSKDIKTIGQYISQKDVKIFIRNIRELKDDLRDLLTIYWNDVFKSVWNEIELSLDKTIDSANYECSLLGDVTQYIANVHSSIKVSKGTIYIQKDVPYMIDLDHVKKVHVFPSTFSGEELLIDTFDESLVIYYNLNLMDSKYVGQQGKELCKIFKALGDDTRLKIAKILWGAPATTQYLAGMLGMAPSTVSTHLKVMKAAGILTNKAIKKYVYYEVNQEALAQLGQQLVGYFKES